MDQFLLAVIFASAAFVILLGVLIACLCFHKRISLIMMGIVFLSSLILYLPLFAAETSGGMNTFLAAFYQTIRIFLIDGNTELLANLPEAAAYAGYYEGFFLLLHILAPVTTATAILSMFRGIAAGIRFWFGGFRTKLYVFSELNDKSLALAKNLREIETEKKKEKREPRGTIVFCDVYRKEEEPQVELMEAAEEIGALCFRRDVLHLRYKKFRRHKNFLKDFHYRKRIEFFLLGGDESENVRQALGLSEIFGERPDTAVYVWARSPESACILDSFRTVPIKSEEEMESSNIFRLRRIDDVEIFVWNTLEEANLFKNRSCDNRLSIVIFGMGEYGMAFLKTAVWMYQCEGVHLEITAIDIGTGAENRLRHECPELLDMEINDRYPHGEKRYDIRIEENIDVFSSDLEYRLLECPEKYPEFADRLRRADTVFVTLGNDDLNIRAALELRCLFDRVHFKNTLAKAVMESHANSDALKGCNLGNISGCPVIYAPVYDILKMQNIMPEDREKDQVLRTYEEVPYRILFKGSFREQYSYDKITRRTMEKTAYDYHMSWVKRNTKIAAEEAEQKYRNERNAECRKYEQFEYYRRSSMSQVIHRRLILASFGQQYECTEPKGTEECKCQNCERGRRTEHLRWNAYMRSEGYCRPDADKKFKVRFSRAKLHYDLVPFDELSKNEQFKDSPWLSADNS